MERMDRKEWFVLNSMIYHINARDDCTKMRREFLEDLKMIIDFDSADFYLADHEHRTLILPVFCNCEMSDGTEAWETAAGQDIFAGTKSMVYRLSDIMEENGRETEFYKKICAQNSWHYMMQMILAQDGRFLGLVTLYRTVGREDFSREDVFMLDTLKEHLTFRLARDEKTRDEGGEKMTVREAVQRYDLTRREEKVLSLLMQGMEHSEICDSLKISENTLKKHILSIYRKTGIRSRVQLFKKVLEHERG